MSLQITNNNYITVPTFSNPYVTRKLNNMDKARIMKEEQDEWTRIYYKMLKGLETMIDIQRQVKNMMKIVVETNTAVTEIEGIILAASINNWTTNTINITEILKDL